MSQKILKFLAKGSAISHPRTVGLVILDMQPGGAERQAFLLAQALSQRGGVEVRLFALRHQAKNLASSSIGAEFPDVPATICGPRAARQVFQRGEILKRARRRIAPGGLEKSGGVPGQSKSKVNVQPNVGGSGDRTEATPGPLALFKAKPSLLLSWWGLYRAIRKHSVDALIAYTPLCGAVAVAVAGKKDIPVVVSERNDLESQPATAMVRDLRSTFYPHATLLTANTEFACRQLQEMFPSKDVMWLPNETHYRESFAIASRVNYKKVVVLSRLAPQKRIDNVIRAFADQKIQQHGIELDIYGDGPERENLERLVEDLGLRSRIIFHGYVPVAQFHDNNERPAFIIVNSLYEGSSNALHEAVSQGLLPVVADTVRELHDVLSDDDLSLVTTNGSAEDIATRLEKFVVDQDYANSTREKVARGFSSYWARVNRQLSATR